MVGTVAGTLQVVVGVLSVVATFGGAYHRIVVKPAREKASEAKNMASSAKQHAESNSEDIEDLGADLQDSVDALRDSVDELVESEQRRRRESRGQTYQIYVLAKAINESDETPDVPVPDENEFLRGGEDDATFNFGD